MKQRGLSARLGRIFAIQLIVIGLATLIGIYITQLIVEDLLTRQALNGEAAHYWALYAENPQQPLPNTANMTGYMTVVDPSPVLEPRKSAQPVHAGPPPEIATLPVGYQPSVLQGQRVLVHVSEQDGKRLYLAFLGDQVSGLAFYFGILPLSIVLLLMYVLLFFAHRWSQRALSPIVELSQRLENVNFQRSGRIDLDLESLSATSDDEVAAMIDAVEHFTTRLDAAIDRERVFTRDAGHELRTPVAVFKGSLDLLERREERPEFEKAALKRMRRTVLDMETLLETLLLLAREDEIAPPKTPTLVNSVAANQLDLLTPYIESSGNKVVLVEHAELQVLATEKIIDIVLGNLLRNALTYTKNGEVTVTLQADSVEVKDSGMGMSERELASAFEPFYRAESSREATKGHGLGLSIVRRLANQFGWQISAVSRPAEGTSVTIRFAAEAQ